MATRSFSGRFFEPQNVVVAGAFVFITGIMVAALFWRGTLGVAPSFNEGWNAYHAQQAFDGLPIYPPHDSLIGNNYPPLSFFVTALVMHLIPDAIYAGRAVSSVSFVATSVLIALICYRRDRDALAAIVGGTVFAGCMAATYPAAAGLYDPQMLAYAIMLAGLFVVSNDDSPFIVICVGALLITCALFVKHNIVSLVVAFSIWLFLYDFVRALKFAAVGLVFGITGFLLCYACFGANFFSAMLGARTYMLGKSWHDLLALPAAVKLLAVLASPAVLAWRDDRWGVFLGLSLLSALAFGTLEAMGDGVGDNAYYDVVIASGLGVGHVLARRVLPRGWLITVCAVACLWGSGLSLAKDALLVTSWRTVQRQSAAEVRAIVDRVASVPGRALCQTTLYCYWAGKAFEFDNFRFMEGLQSGGETDEALVRRVESGVYGSIVVNAPENDFVLTRAVLAAIHKGYVIDFANGRQIIYVRRPG